MLSFVNSDFKKNWKELAIRVDDNAGIVIPRIICPLEPDRALALERIVPYTISIPYHTIL